MKPFRLLPALLLVMSLSVICAVAQDAGEAVVVEEPYILPGGFMDVVLSGGLLGLLNWAGIFFWAILGLPLGILSIVHCAKLRVRQYPLSTKLLILGVVWLFVLGWVGVAHGIIFVFSMLPCGLPDAGFIGFIALNISQAVFPIAGALAVCQLYLVFLLISMVIVHFKHRKML